MTKKDGDPGDGDPADKDPDGTDPDGDDPNDDPGDDDTDTDPDDDDFTPPTREEVERMRATMRARKEERDRARAELRKLKASGGSDAGKDDDARRRDEQDAERERWRTSAARSAAAAQLTAAGFSGSAKQARNLTKLLDLTEAEPDKDGDFDFGDEIDDLKDEYPMLFRSGDEPPGRRARTTTADRGRDAGRDDTDDPTTRTSKAMLRRMGRRV